MAVAVGAALASPSRAYATSWMTELRGYDQRVANIGYRLTRSASSYCAVTAPQLGFSLDAIDRYNVSERGAAAAELGLTSRVQISGVAEGGPADLAGARVGDDVVTFAGAPTSVAPSAVPSEARTEFIQDEMQLSAKLGPVELGLARGQKPVAVHFVPQEGCDVRWVLSTRSSITPFTDGHDIDLPAGLLRFATSDDEVAFVAAHELAHAIFNQRRAPPKGAAAKRRVEYDADSLAVALMMAAGFEPDAAGNFWDRFAERDTFGFLRSSDHPSTKARTTEVRRAIARLRDGLLPNALAQEIIEKEVTAAVQ